MYRHLDMTICPPGAGPIHRCLSPFRQGGLPGCSTGRVSTCRRLLAQQHWCSCFLLSCPPKVQLPNPAGACCRVGQLIALPTPLSDHFLDLHAAVPPQARTAKGSVRPWIHTQREHVPGRPGQATTSNVNAIRRMNDVTRISIWQPMAGMSPIGIAIAWARPIHATPRPSRFQPGPPHAHHARADPYPGVQTPCAEVDRRGREWYEPDR